jgi:hypothetical protein
MNGSRAGFAWLAAGMLVVPAVVLGPATASAAPNLEQCLASSQTGQEQKHAGKLLEARRELLVCAAASCPDAVKADCAELLDAIERALPTVAFDAKDDAGVDLSAVRVAVDGVEVADHLDGLPIPVDPGRHTFTFTMAERSPVERTFIIVEGEKARHERIVIPGPGPVPVATAPAPPPASAPPPVPAAPVPNESSPSSWSTQKTLAVAAAGAGVAGVVVGSVFGLTASSDWSRAQRECNATTCPDRNAALIDHDATTSAAAVSTVAFVAAGVLLAGGVVLFLTAPSGAPSAASLQVAPAAGPGTGGMLLRGRF